MRRYYLITLLLFVINCFGQEESKNHIFLYEKEPIVCFCDFPKMLYIETNCPKFERIYITSKVVDIKYYKDNIIKFKFDCSKEISQIKDTINFYGIDNYDTNCIGAIKVILEPFPPPFAFIANKRGGSISKNDLLKSIALKVSYGPYRFLFPDPYINIISFKICAISKNKIYNATSRGVFVSKEQLKIFKNLESGDIIYFEDIFVRVLTDSNKIELSPIRFQIE